MSNDKILDILKIQKTIRKAIKDYSISAKYDEEVLISLVSVDLYLCLDSEDSTPPHPKVTKKGAAASPAPIPSNSVL
ncbi:hypothetical protein [Desulfosporosinus sp. SB140]|uniref:hypothetical protein n=1 Tax=Desulfosporosinus paludis TaxID=3115649 RepID=UPI00388E024A